MADQRLELPTQGVSLDPIDHVSSVASTKCNRVIGIHIIHVRLDVLEEHLQVFVRPSSILVVDVLRQILAVPGTAADVGSNDDVALLGEDGRIPACRPGFVPSTLGAAVDEKGQGVALGG